VDEGTSKVLLEKSVRRFEISRDGRTLVGEFNSRITVYDLENRSRRELTSHGDRINNNGVLDPTGRLVVTGDNDGVIRVGPITGEEPHLLLGHEGPVTWLNVSPEGDWIASGGADHTVRLWPMPDMNKQPFHTLPYETFLDRLRGLTNLRAVRDEEFSTGYRIDIGPFPGWEKVPEW
jgi:WD40 repeat protein